MTTLANRLKASRLQAGMTQQRLASKSGVTRVAISKAEQGLTKTFNGDTLLNISMALGVDPVWLQTGKHQVRAMQKEPLLTAKAVNTEHENIAPTKQPQYRYEYPKLNWIQAGEFSMNGDDYSAFDIENWYDSIKYAGERGYWLEVKGDSMSSPVGITFPEGMMILVNPDECPTPGRYVIAEIKDSHEATFKKLISDAGREYLKPLNPNYAPIPLNDKINIIGVVIDARWDIF